MWNEMLKKKKDHHLYVVSEIHNIISLTPVSEVTVHAVKGLALAMLNKLRCHTHF